MKNLRRAACRTIMLALVPMAGLAGLGYLTMSNAAAALKVGDNAPDFTTQAAIGGKAFTFSLAEALKKGPVVLYFYPKAFTPGCTVEAHNFAEATDKFAALGATLVGMSGDDIDTLKEFSVKECRNKFAVAADADGKIMKKYDAKMAFLPSTADRISYVINPAGKVIYAYSSLSPDNHVENTLKVVQDLNSAKH
jgi:peroxiredoxin